MYTITILSMVVMRKMPVPCGGTADVDTPAGRLRYRIDGPEAGPPVLLINSLGTTMDLWSAQAGAARAI